MSGVYFCFGLDSAAAGTLSVSENLERDYGDVYKNAATFFYSHKTCPFFFSFTGYEISYYHKKHPELLKIIHELENRKQTEIVGGGYWNPVFPLLYPSDRSGQIETLSAAIRTSIGKRPRGMRLCADSWDSCMVSSLQTCGMEYVFLDNSLVPQSKQCYLPLVMSERSKSVDIIPVYGNLKEWLLNHGQEAETKEQKKNIAAQFFKDIQKKASKAPLPHSMQNDWRIVTILFNVNEFKEILENGTLESIYEAASEIEGINVSLPNQCRKVMQKIPVYIPACVSENIAKWTAAPYVCAPQGHVSHFDFLQAYPQVKALYDRMLYVSMLVNQCHGDKMRKNTAREKLWEAQSGEMFICSPEGIFATSQKRQRAYSLLTEAEQFVREASEFKESVTSLDYNGDGMNEYVIRMQNYTACVYPVGGAVRELDIFHNAKNYADNLSLVEKFDGDSDNYWRGLFVDHLFSASDFERYKKNGRAGDGIFSRIRYEESRFSSPRQEIQLVASAEFGEKRQHVSLRKKYVASSNGFTVQYILKNGSAETLCANLIVESNFAVPNFSGENADSYDIHVVSDGSKKEFAEKDFSENNVQQNVSALQIIDGNISFVFEPNENCDAVFAPKTFMRPTYMENAVVKISADGKSLCTAFFWQIELEPGHETEKTINFGILHSRKENKRKKAK